MSTAGQRKWSNEEVIDAIRGEGRWSGADGMPNPLKTATRKALALRLKVAYATVARWIKENPDIAEALAEARETDIDLAEEKLVDLIDGGSFPAVKLMLETRGAGRGYARRTLVSADFHLSRDPLADLSDAELDAILGTDGDAGDIDNGL